MLLMPVLRQKLGAAGRLLHVFCEESGRVSYKPYREASNKLMTVIQTYCAQAAPGSVVEVASIDEAYIQLHVEATQHRARMDDGAALAREIRAQCESVVHELSLLLFFMLIAGLL